MADNKLGSLFIEYRATADKFLADLHKMTKGAKDFEKTIKPLRDQSLTIGTGMTVVGGAVVTAFTAMAKQAANYGDAIRDASIRTGISTETLSGLKFAAEQTGTSFEGVAGSLQRMSRVALTSASNTGKSADAFSKIGISVKDASGQLRPMGDILGDVSDRFAKMKDGTEKAAAAQLLFGKNGAQMIEFLNQGKEGMEAFQKRAEELGLLVGPEFAAMADQFNDSTKEMQAAQLGLSVTIGTLVLPVLTKLVNLVTGGIVAFRKFAQAHPEVVKAVFALSTAILGTGGLLVGLAAVLTILPKLGVAFRLMTGPVGLAVLAIEGLIAAMFAFPKFRGVVLDVLKRVTEAVAFLGSYIGSLGLTVWKLVTGQWREAWSIFSNSVELAFKETADAGNAFDDVVKGVGDALTFTAPPAFALAEGIDDLGLNFDAVGGKASKARDEIAELNKAFIEQIRPADQLSAKLQILLRRFDERDIVRAYRDEIIETAEIQRQFGGAIDETITRLEKQALVMKRAADIIKENRDKVLEGVKLPDSPDFLNLAPIVPPTDLSRDFESLDFAVQNLGKSTQETARKSAEMFEARATDAAADIARVKKWEQAWATAVGNIASKFADKTVEGLFSIGRDTDKIRSIENQITNLKRDAERERLQNIIDSTVKGTRARTLAEKQMAAYEKQLGAERGREREKELRDLERQLEAEKNLFRKFVNGVKNLFVELGKSIVKIMVTDAFTSIAKAFSDVVIKPLSEKLGKLFGLASKGGSVADSVIGSGTKAASGVGGSVGSVAGSGTSLTGSFISGGLAAAGSIVGALLTKGNAKRTEENTREVRDWLELAVTAWNPLFHESRYFLASIDRNIATLVGTKSGTVANVTSAASVAPSSVPAVMVNVTANTSINPTLTFERSDMSVLDIRDKVVPEFLTAVDLNIRGVGEKLAQSVANKLQGLVGTEAAYGI